jgi:hypothetical protein
VEVGGTVEYQQASKASRSLGGMTAICIAGPICTPDENVTQMLVMRNAACNLRLAAGDNGKFVDTVREQQGTER